MADHSTSLRWLDTPVSFGAEFIPPYDPQGALFRPLIQMTCARYGLGTMTIGMRRNDGRWPLPLIMAERWHLPSPPTKQAFRDKVREYLDEIDANYQKHNQKASA